MSAILPQLFLRRPWAAEADDHVDGLDGVCVQGGDGRGVLDRQCAPQTHSIPVPHDDGEYARRQRSFPELPHREGQHCVRLLACLLDWWFLYAGSAT